MTTTYKDGKGSIVKTQTKKTKDVTLVYTFIDDKLQSDLTGTIESYDCKTQKEFHNRFRESIKKDKDLTIIRNDTRTVKKRN